MEDKFGKIKGVLETAVGYTGGNVENPSYTQVCSGNTGHAEAVHILYDPDIVSYGELLDAFFRFHDPTQLNRQGPDVGKQYRSAIFYADEEQKTVAERLIGLLKEKGYRIATEVVRADKFWKAEDYHQDYYEKTGKRPYCHVYKKRF